MMKNTIHSRFICLILIIGFLLLIMGCGGVAKNPAQAPWKNEDRSQPGEGGLTEKGTEQGAPEIREGAGFEELYATGVESLLGGFIKNATEAFKKAVDEKKDDPSAALAYVVAKIAGSPKEFSLMMQPGIDYFYYSTPLIGRWEFFPAPLAEEDSYFLRLAALGTKYGTAGKPPSMPGIPGGAPPTPSQPPGGETLTTTPEGGVTIPGTGGETEFKIDESGDTYTKDGSTKTPGEGGDRSSQFSNMGRSLFQGPGTGAGGSGPLDTGGTGESRMHYEATGGETQIEYFQFDKDIFPQLIADYREISRSYCAGYLNLDAANTSANELEELLLDLEKKLEDAQRKVEDEKFTLELPFKLDNRDGLYNISFQNYDYFIILGYIKILLGEIKYRSAYTAGNSLNLLVTPPADKNGDNILNPDEYFPVSPFGELRQKSDETFNKTSAYLSEGLEFLVRSLDEFYSDDKLGDFPGNLIYPVNADTLLLDLLADERDSYSDFQVLMASGKGQRTFNSPSGSVKADVDISYLFGSNAPESVSALLPDLDASSYEPVTDENGNVFPDPTWNGLFKEEFDNFDVFRLRDDITGLLTYQGNGVKDVSIKTSAGKNATSDEKGRFTIKDVDLNELVGVSVTVSSPQVDTPAQAQIRNMWVSVDLEVISSNLTASMPVVESPLDETVTDVGDIQDGVVSTGGEDESGAAMSRIQRIKEEREKQKNAEKDEGEDSEEEEKKDESESESTE